MHGIFSRVTYSKCYGFVLCLITNFKLIDMKQIFVFIYAKDKEIKALNIEESKRLNDKLLKEGWKHTKTLDVFMWIQYLHNNCEDVDVLDEVNLLSKVGC